MVRDRDKLGVFLGVKRGIDKRAGEKGWVPSLGRERNGEEAVKVKEEEEDDDEAMEAIEQMEVFGFRVQTLSKQQLIILASNGQNPNPQWFFL